MKKVLVTLLVCALGISLFAGCGPENNEEKEAANETKVTQKNDNEMKAGDEKKVKEDIVLNVAYWMDNQAIMEKVTEEFTKEHPNITFNLMDFPDKEYEATLAVQLAGGAGIDLFAMKSNAQYSDLATRGECLPLEEFIVSNKFDVSGYGPMYEGIKVDGEIMAMPFRKTTWILYYNKYIFDEAGVPYPSDDMTWEEFSELAASVTSGSGENKVWGAYLHTWPISSFGPGLQTGATIFDEDLSVFSDVLQMRLNLEDNGVIMPYVEQIATNAHYNAAFQKGNVAMNIIGDWHIGQLRQAMDEGNINFEWDITSLPHPEGVSNNTSWGMPTTMAISSYTEKQEAAWEFLSFLCGPEGAEIVASLGILPGYMNDDITETYLGDGSLKPDNLESVLEQKVYVEYPPIPGINSIVNNIYKEEFGLVFADEQTPQEAIVIIKERIQSEVQ